MKWQSCVLNNGWPPDWNAASVTKPESELIEPAEELEVHEALEHVVDLRVERRHVLEVARDVADVVLDMPTQSVAQPIRSSRDAGRERSALDLAGARRADRARTPSASPGPPLCTVDGSTQMKFAVHVLVAVDLRVARRCR